MMVMMMMMMMMKMMMTIIDKSLSYKLTPVRGLQIIDLLEVEDLFKICLFREI